MRTHSEGAWRVGNVTFRDEVTILRVLDDGSTDFDIRAFKAELEETLQQLEVLIIIRDVDVVS